MKIEAARCLLLVSLIKGTGVGVGGAGGGLMAGRIEAGIDTAKGQGNIRSTLGPVNNWGCVGKGCSGVGW